ncbi:MAG: bifunctional GNAT family N-acetyltransferase/carbon-nitrogen hydrolase family protein [Niabella sp.]
MSEIKNVELKLLIPEQYEEMKVLMIASYPSMPHSIWKEHQIKTITTIFPEGQIAVYVNDKLAGCALSIITSEDKIKHKHTYRDITGNYTFTTHDDEGDILYGIDVFVNPEYRGLRLGRRLYDYRKELCEKLNLKGIVFGGRIPGYFEHADTLSPKEYINKVKSKEIHDPVFNFQLSNDFHPVRITKGYLEGDVLSDEYAVIMEWDNIYYEKPTDISIKKVVRLGLIQWQMRLYKNLDEMMQQVEYFIDSVSAYRCDFALFPEFFNAPLMADYNMLSAAEAVKKLAEFTPKIKERFSDLAVSYNINIITGSMPDLRDGKLYNVGHLCRRDGTIEEFVKIHVTPDEERVWGLCGGNEVKTFETDCGKIGILICYDSEFPELSRLLADENMDILFVPFLTDTQNGYFRVRHCAQARAIENECYVAIAGSVGNLPKVHNMDIQYAQSAVLTPCDFSFPANGVKAEATPNTEMVLIADVDVDLLRQLHSYGSVKNLIDRRKDMYNVVKVKA